MNDEKLLCTLFGGTVEYSMFKDWKDQRDFLLLCAQFLRIAAHIYFAASEQPRMI